MEIYPTSVLPVYPLIVQQQYYTLITDMETPGYEQRRKTAAFPRRLVTLRYDVLSVSEINTLWEFYTDMCGRWEPFYFIMPSSGATEPTYKNEYLGRGTGSLYYFDIKSVNTVAYPQIYVDGILASYTFHEGGGGGGSDRAQLDVAPAFGTIVTARFSGRLILKARYANDIFSRELFSTMLYTTGIDLIEIKNPLT